MRVHKVRSPFLCRPGQFTPGKRDLCIGLDYQTLKKTEKFYCFLGDNLKAMYEIDANTALTAGQSWTNPKGKTVMIVPLSVATRIEKKPPETPMASAQLVAEAHERERREEKRQELIIQTLF